MKLVFWATIYSLVSRVVRSLVCFSAAEQTFCPILTKLPLDIHSELLSVCILGGVGSRDGGMKIGPIMDICQKFQSFLKALLTYFCTNFVFVQMKLFFSQQNISLYKYRIWTPHDSLNRCQILWHSVQYWHFQGEIVKIAQIYDCGERQDNRV